MIKTTAEDLLQRNRARLGRARSIFEALRDSTTPVARHNVLGPLNDIGVELGNVASEAGLFSEVHPDPDVREAAESLDREAARLRTEVMQDPRLHAMLDAVDPAQLDTVAARVRLLTLEDMKRSGAALADTRRDDVRVLREELLALEQEFSRNIRDAVGSITVSDADLEGLPDDFVTAHPRAADGRRVITTNHPDYIPFMSYSESDAARRSLATVNLNRAVPRNLEVLRGMLAKRHALATLLGYSSWAEYATADKMSGSPTAVREFIERAYAATRESGAAERDAILAEKRRTVPDASMIGQWEHSYWVERIKRETFSFDPRTVRPYFEYRKVRAAILDLASRLFGLTFTSVDQPDVWHPSVDTYEVTIDGRRMGRISLDMHPRDGKYNHAACFTWRPGVGGVQEPHSVLVCNFPDPAHGGPALMEHGEVVTFFHEFGHLVHNIMRGAIPWTRVAGVAEWDFVEAPSQFLEEWIYDAEVLRSFATHVETGEPIPVELVERLRGARDFGRGMFVQRQLYLAAISLELHDRDPRDLDTTRLVFDLARTLSPTELLPDTHFEASFGHLEGYSSVYYTYCWSLVIAKDLHSAFKNGLMDLEQTKRYRDLILAPGGTKPAAELVKDFLGRPYDFNAFAEWLAP